MLAYLGMPGSRKRRLLQLHGRRARCTSWSRSRGWGRRCSLPAHDRPYAIGSTNGSAWNAAFVFNGTDRLSGKSIEPQTVYQPGHHYPTATQSERDHIPIVPTSPTRLFARVGPLSGERLGLVLLLALLLGIPALIGGVLRKPERGEDADYRMRRATAAGLGVWLLTGIVLFSDMARLHPRYVEGLVPAVTATLGIGAGVGDLLLGTRPADRADRRHGGAGRTTASACCTGGREAGGSRSPARSARSRSRAWRAFA